MDFYLDSLLHLPYVTVDGCKEVEGTAVLKLKFLNETIACPECHATLDDIHQVEEVLIRDLPVFGKPVYLRVPRRQFHCASCQRFWTERLEFVSGQRHFTQRYAQAVYEQVKQSSIEAVSRAEGISASTVRALFEEQAANRIKKVECLPNRLSLDEFSRHKGHRDLLTTVVDLEQARLIEVINSHRQKDVIAALQAFPTEVRATVKEVCIDMWGGFTRVIEKLFPNAKITYDRFHVMQHVNEELNQLRHQMQIKFEGLPHLLWKNREDLTDEQRQRLDEGLNNHPCLEIAYELKEDLRQIYERCRTVQGAEKEFQQWIRIAGQLYPKSAQMIEQHLSGICNYFEHHTTSGVTEGINTKIKLIKRQGYGFNNFEHFRLRLLACFDDS